MRTTVATEDHGNTVVVHRAQEVEDGVQRCPDCGFEFPLPTDGSGFFPGDWIHISGPVGIELRRASSSHRITAKRCSA